MQPIHFDQSPEAISALWQQFMRVGALPPEAADQFDPAVLQSWRRCISRFNPESRPRMASISSQALTSILRAQQDLITVATPFMEDIHQFTEGSGYAVVLTDGAVCVLAVSGDPAAIEAAADAGLQQGTYWSEDNVGTNALGMVLNQAMPVQVVGAEHYFSLFHNLVSAAAPIHDVRGRVVGVLGMVGPLNRAGTHTLGLVMAGARAITNQLQANWHLEEANRRLSEMNTVLGTIDEGVIVWNANGEVLHVNRQAGDILRINPRTVVGRPLPDVVDFPADLVEVIRNGGELRGVEIVLQVQRRPTRCLVTLQPVQEAAGRPVSYVALLNPIEHVRRIAQSQFGSQTSLTIDDVQAESAGMRQLIRQARVAARGTAPVLIRGEGGVGKNLLARAIHNEGDRADQPFVDINCRAIPHELMAREMLGQEKDATTHGQPSKFELAEGGTLLLDELESLSLELQSALLHIIETRHVMRLGSSHPIPVNVRIIAATTANLEDLMAQGSLLPHLYYRFGVFHMELPPLRERVEDIPLLAERFLARHTQRDNRPMTINTEAMAILSRYPWPGNVRELESVLERAISQSRSEVIDASDLPEMVRSGRVLMPTGTHAQPVLSVTDAEREAILRAGWACQGRVTEMATMLGIGRSTLWRKLKRHNITPAAFKA
jgi:transcriptional activator for dhaKLM operon